MAASILLMEDEVDQASILSDALGGWGYDVTIAYEFDDAMAALDHGRFDLLIADIYIKKEGSFGAEGGFLLIGRLRNPQNTGSRAWMRKVPIIAITGAAQFPGQADILKSAKSIGADAAMQKPVKMNDLRRLITELIARNTQDSSSRLA